MFLRLPDNNKIGIWICNAGASLISHGLLMESVCENFPNHFTASFLKKDDDKRRYFHSHIDIPFFYCKYKQTLKKKRDLYLLGIGEATTDIFIEECNLIDFEFPVKMVGIVLIVAKQPIVKGYLPNLEIEWAQKQNLPVVIAGTGYSHTDFNEVEFRQILKLDIATKIIVGPDINPESGFDKSFAQRLIEAFE